MLSWLHKDDASSLAKTQIFDPRDTAVTWQGDATGEQFVGTVHGDALNGGGGNDRVSGHLGDDVLIGSAGDDVIIGGAGNDKAVFSGNRANYTITQNQDGSYTVQDTRAGGDGRDTVSEVETLQFADSATPPGPQVGTPGPVANLRLIGTRKADKLVGGDGNDTLYGRLGKDVLTGGKGKDVFVFDTKPDRKTNLDKVTDFKVIDDTIWLDNKYMAKLGKGTPTKPVKLNKAFLKNGATAKDANDYLVYNKATGVLSYDADGSGVSKAVEIALLSKNLKLTAADFFVI